MPPHPPLTLAFAVFPHSDQNRPLLSHCQSGKLRPRGGNLPQQLTQSLQQTPASWSPDPVISPGHALLHVLVPVGN